MLELVLTHARFQSYFIDFVCLCKTCEARTFQMFIKKTIKLLPIHQYRCDHFFWGEGALIFQKILGDEFEELPVAAFLFHTPVLPAKELGVGCKVDSVNWAWLCV